MRRPPRWLGLSLAFVAVGCAGLTGGWVLANATVVAQAPQPETSILEVPLAEAGEGSSMPDVRGLGRDDALQVLVDAGVPASVVTVSSRPAAGEPDTVVQQTPAYGAVAFTSVQLVVAEPAAVPALAGLDVDDGVAVLNDLGTRVERTSGYDPDRPPGVILATAPSEGEALAGSVSIVVNSAPSAIYLSELSPIRGGCSSSGELFIDGVAYSQGLECSSASARANTWLLAKSVDRVTATVGVSDTAEPGTVLHVEVSADGTVLFSEDVAYGSPRQLDIRTTGALQLSVSASPVSADAGSARAALGDPRVLGAPDAIAQLRQQ